MRRLIQAAALGATAACAAPSADVIATQPAVDAEPTTTTEVPPETTTTTTEAPAPVTVSVTPPTAQPAVEPFGVWPPDEEADPMGNDAYRARILACIRSYEQSGDGYATETGNGFSGAYQFTPPTWYRSVLGAVDAGMLEVRDVWYAGEPASEAPPRVQDAAAWWLYLQEGFGPWPTPNRLCRA